MQRLNITKGDAFILVYSVTSRQSLDELKPLWESIREVKGNSVPIMLVANKTDDTENQELTSQDGEATAKDWGCQFLETSAKANHNVQELFEQLLSIENDALSQDSEDGEKKGRAKKIQEKCKVM